MSAHTVQSCCSSLLAVLSTRVERAASSFNLSPESWGDLSKWWRFCGTAQRGIWLLFLLPSAWKEQSLGRAAPRSILCHVP